jgi:hypothetical protein
MAGCRQRKDEGNKIRDRVCNVIMGPSPLEKPQRTRQYGYAQVQMHKAKDGAAALLTLMNPHPAGWYP